MRCYYNGNCSRRDSPLEIVYDGDLVNVIDNKMMKSGVDRNCDIVLDIDDKITTIAEEYNVENRYLLILRTMNSLIGETSNYATVYHNKTSRDLNQKKKYEEYIDLLSVCNGKNIDFAKTGIIFNVPRHIAKYGRPLPYFMRYRSSYYMKQKDLNRSMSNMNRLCFDIEKWQSKNITFKRTFKDFDYKIMINKKIKMNDDIFKKIEEVYLEFCKEMAELSKDNTAFRNPDRYFEYLSKNYPDVSIDYIKNFTINWNYYYDKYKKICKEICTNKQELANIAVTLCYEKYPNKNKKFIWKVASDGILLNIKQKSIYLPKQCDDGEFEYLGKRYTMMEVLDID